MKQFTVAVSPYGGNVSNITPFDRIFTRNFNPTVTNTLKGADALLLWGGTDINPSLYGKPAHSRNDCYLSSDLSHRDFMEWYLLREAYQAKIPVIGVCRGAQLICAFAGGTLIQHTDAHYSAHNIETHDGLSMMAPANHHQVMNPTGTKYELLAWAKTNRTKLYEDLPGEPSKGELIDNDIDPEVVWFPEVRGLALQPHPEWGTSLSDFNTWVLNTVREYCIKEEHVSC